MSNLAFATALLMHRAIIKICLGNLREIESEMVRERLSSAIMETLLALTIFREEFSGVFVAMFGALLFLKSLHWIVSDRVEYIEVTPSVSVLQHIRIAALMGILLVRGRVHSVCSSAEPQ
jgi:E3 ubiquitin-protein ligase synoviolin